MKTCFKCLCAKPLSEFYKHAQMGDGHLNKCKDCTKKDVKESRLAKIDYYRSYDKMRASMPHRRALAKRVQDEWKKTHPIRRAANVALGNAVRSGKVKKQPCWVCGDKALAHHPDYDRPLDVVWLCQAHHKQTHALVANEPEMEKAA
jgi:hypothetical protein